MSNIITEGKERVYRHTAARRLCYLAMLLCLLLFWLSLGDTEIAFVYNAF